MRRVVMAGLVGLGLSAGMLGGASAQEAPTADEIRELIGIQIGAGISVFGGGSVVTDTMMVTTTNGAIGADGGVSVAEGDVPGGSDGTGALAVNN